MQRREVVAIAGAAALGLATTAEAGIARHRAQVGTASVIGFGSGGAEMLAHAQVRSQFEWRSGRGLPQLAGSEGLLLLVDPSERGVTDAAASAARSARAQGRRVLAVVRRQRSGAPRYGRAMNEARYLRKVADVSVEIGASVSARDVVWDSLLAPFVQDGSCNLDLEDLCEPAAGCASVAIGCGRGVLPRDAMLAALAHPLLGPARALAADSLLVMVSMNGKKVLLRETNEAMHALRAAAPDARMAVAWRYRPFTAKETLVHLVAFGAQRRIEG